MTTRLSRRLFAVGVAAGLGLGVMASEAHALLKLAATVGGANFCASDNNLGPCGFGIAFPDVDPTIGVLALNPVFIGGSLELAASLQTSTLGPLNVLSSSSLQVRNPTAAPITATFAIGDIGYVPPLGAVSTAGSGTWVTAVGSSATLQWFVDTANAQGADTATDTPGTLVDSFAYTVTLLADSFSHNGGPFPISDSDSFSMTLAYTLTIAPGGSLISRGQTMITQPQVPAPEPGTIMLLSSGLALGAWRYGRKVFRHRD